jgi:hypothetical protein
VILELFLLAPVTIARFAIKAWQPISDFVLRASIGFRPSSFGFINLSTSTKIVGKPANLFAKANQ